MADSLTHTPFVPKSVQMSKPQSINFLPAIRPFNEFHYTNYR